MCILLSDQDITTPMPPGAIRIQAPRPYAFWWQMTEACSGRTGDIADIRWFVVPNADSFAVHGKQYNGYWFENNSIVIASTHRLVGQLVRHEMLHALLARDEERVA